jgi:hypothetical protein
MNTLLVLAVLGQWTYAGFHSDPPKAKSPVDPPPAAPAPKPKNNLLRSPECNCPPYNCQCDIPCRCAKPATAKPAEPAKEAPKTWVPIYRRDSQGNQCTGYAGYERELDAFIRGRESALAQQAQAPVQTYTPIPQGFTGFATAGACVGGQCAN